MTELPSVFIWIVIMATGYGIIRHIRLEHKDNKKANVGANIVNSIFMMVMMFLYRRFSRWLVNWENHRFESEWEGSFVTKMFSFSFVNSYITLFYFAFYENDYN